MTLGHLTCDVIDESCKFVLDPGMDIQDSSYMGGAASELLGCFALLALVLCCDICDITAILVVVFLSKPNGQSALFRVFHKS